MNSRIPRVAAAVAAATAVAGGGYALGSQSGGAAAAAKRPAPAHCRHGGGGRGVAGLAARLGVPEAKLRTALSQLRGSAPGARHPAVVAAVARALQIDQAKVAAAFKAVRRAERPRGAGARGARRGGAFAAALAAQLGAPTAKVRSTLDQAVHAQRAAALDHTAATLASALGVHKAKVAAALAKLRPQPGARSPGVDRAHGAHSRPPGGGRLGGHARPSAGARRGGHARPGGGGRAAALAKELGLPVADVKAALQKLHAQRRQDQTARRDAFATKLAGKLGLSVDKVKAALGPGPGFGLHAGPGGPAGHGRGAGRRAPAHP